MRQELPRSFDSRTGYTNTFQVTDASGFKQTWKEKRYLPARVQISLLVLCAKPCAANSRPAVSRMCRRVVLPSVRGVRVAMPRG